MKYTIIGFQQQKLIENNLNTEDALILRTIKDMYSSASMEFIIEDGDKYMWISYSYLLKQLPIIGSRSKLMRKIKIYEDKQLIKRILRHERKGQKGNFSYIAPTIKLDSLQDYDPYVKMTQPLYQNDITLVSKRHNKDSSIKDSSIKDTTTSSRDEFLKLTKLYQKCGFKVNAFTSDWIEEILKEYGYEWSKQALLTAEKAGKISKSYVEGILQNWNRSGGMQLEKKKEVGEHNPYKHMKIYR